MLNYEGVTILIAVTSLITSILTFAVPSNITLKVRILISSPLFLFSILFGYAGLSASISSSQSSENSTEFDRIVSKAVEPIVQLLNDALSKQTTNSNQSQAKIIQVTATPEIAVNIPVVKTPKSSVAQAITTKPTNTLETTPPSEPNLDKVFQSGSSASESGSQTNNGPQPRNGTSRNQSDKSSGQVNTNGVVGNLIVSCIPNGGWVRIYRLKDRSLSPQALQAKYTGLESAWERYPGSFKTYKIDGIPIDLTSFNANGEPYYLELVDKNNKVIASTGNFLAQQPIFLIKYGQDNSWNCR